MLAIEVPAATISRNLRSSALDHSRAWERRAPLRTRTQSHGNLFAFSLITDDPGIPFNANDDPYASGVLPAQSN